MKYELRVAGSAAAPAPRVETSPPPNEPTQLHRATLCLTGQEGDHFSSQPIPRWLVNAIGIEIVLNLVILTTLIRGTLSRWRP